MSTNAYVRLRRLLPPSPVWVGKVLAHYSDDTSLVELPTNEGAVGVASGLAVGSRVRVRGTTVAVGQRAFIRDGVIETQAPSGDPVEHVIGKVVQQFASLVFSGPISDVVVTAGVAAAADFRSYFSGGVGDLTFDLVAGVLPGGLTVADGQLSGTAGQPVGRFPGLVVRATDTTGATAVSNAFAVVVQPGGEVLVDIPFLTDYANFGTIGGAMAVRYPSAFSIVDGALQVVGYGPSTPATSRAALYISAAALALPDLSIARTISVKFRIVGATAGAGVLWSDSDSSPTSDLPASYRVGLDSTSVLQAAVDGSAGFLVGAPLTGNAEHEVAISADASGVVRILLDGHIIGSGSRARTRVAGMGTLIVQSPSADQTGYVVIRDLQIRTGFAYTSDLAG